MPVGIHLPAFKGVDRNGKPVVIDPKNAGTATVLFVFSPTCSICARNWRNWNSVLESQGKLGWRPIFVNVGNHTTVDFQNSHGLEHYMIVEEVAKDTALSYRLFHTPETIVLSRSGEVMYVQDGELSPSAITSLSQKLLNVN